MSEETLERASARLGSMLGLVQQACKDARAHARELAARGHIVDPEASTLFAEAEAYLVSHTPRIERALPAAMLAATREPDAYGPLFLALFDLLRQGLEDTAAAELAAATLEELPSHPMPEAP